MNTSDIILLGSMYVTVLAFYIPLLFYIRSRANQRRAEQAFYKGVAAIFDNSAEGEDLIAEIGILYKRLSERYAELTKRFRSPAELLEEFIVGIDTLDDRAFKQRYRMERPLPLRPRLLETLKNLREQSPFASLSSKEANLLSTLINAVESGNPELGKSVIKQLAEELEITGANLRSQNQKNTISFIVSVVSVLLTVFFGIVSFVPLLRA